MSGRPLCRRCGSVVVGPYCSNCGTPQDGASARPRTSSGFWDIAYTVAVFVLGLTVGAAGLMFVVPALAPAPSGSPRGVAAASRLPTASDLPERTPSVATSGTPASFVRHVAPDGSFSIALPDTWTANFEQVDTRLFEGISPSEGSVGQSACSVTLERGALREATLESYAAEEKARIDNETTVTSSTYQTRVGSHPAIGLQAGRTTFAYFEAPRGSGDLWNVSCAAPLTGNPFDPVFEQIRATFEIAA